MQCLHAWWQSLNTFCFLYIYSSLISSFSYLSFIIFIFFTIFFCYHLLFYFLLSFIFFFFYTLLFLYIFISFSFCDFLAFSYCWFPLDLRSRGTFSIFVNCTNFLGILNIANFLDIYWCDAFFVTYEQCKLCCDLTLRNILGTAGAGVTGRTIQTFGKKIIAGAQLADLSLLAPPVSRPWWQSSLQIFKNMHREISKIWYIGRAFWHSKIGISRSSW